MLRFRFSGGRIKLLEPTVRQAVEQNAETIIAAGSTPQPNMDTCRAVESISIEVRMGTFLTRHDTPGEAVRQCEARQGKAEIPVKS